MEIKQYVRVLRSRWVLIAVFVAVCVAAAGVYTWMRDPVYAAHTQLFVSAKSETSGVSPSEVYQGGLASQSRADTYAQILSSPPVVEAVIRKLGLSRSTSSVQSAITATVPAGTVLIDVTVEDESPQRAKEISDALAVEFPRFVDTLERADGPEESPVEMTVTSPAVLPSSPDSPSTAFYLAAGALLGLILGIAAAVVREVLDTRVRDDEVAEAIAGARVLGHIPRDAGAVIRPLVVVDAPDSPEAEAYRRLRTNLRVVTIDRDRRSLVVTSAASGEGKTLVAANLGFAFAQAGHRVALVDADLRRPRLADLLDLEPAPGLSELLSGEVSEEPLHYENELPLEVLTAGSPAPNPSELLESDRFGELLDRLTSRAEIVIIDSPALLPVSDAAVITRVVAAVLMVARVRFARAEALDAAAESLRAVGKQPIGAVLNAVPGRVGREYVYGPSAADETGTPAASSKRA